MLDIGWSAPPFPDNTTAPSSGLRFEVTQSGDLKIDFVYTTFDSDEGELHSTPVLHESVSAFCERAAKVFDASCVPPASAHAAPVCAGVPGTRA